MKRAVVASDAWLAAGIVFTTATQLRLGGRAFPIGPGEILLSSWLLGASIRLLRTMRVRRSLALASIGTFWGLGLLLLAAGAVEASTLGLADAPSFAHDGLAYLLVALVFAIYTANPVAKQRAGDTCRWVILFTATLFSVLYLYARHHPVLGPIQLWYGERFTGWSTNPNQLAIAIVMLPFLSMYLASENDSLLARAGYGLSIIAAIVVGLASRSDALVVGWLAAISVMCGLLWYRSATNRKRGRYTALLVYVLAPALILSALTLAGHVFLTTLEIRAADLYSQGNQGSVRVTLWLHGLQAAAASPIVGLGPGAHSGLYGPFEGAEAHNTLIDWGASAGVLGALLYIVLIWRALRVSWRSKQLLLTVSVVAGSVLSLFHYVLRHPIFWFYFATIFLLAEKELAGRGVRLRKSTARISSILKREQTARQPVLIRSTPSPSQSPP